MVEGIIKIFLLIKNKRKVFIHEYIKAVTKAVSITNITINKVIYMGLSILLNKARIKVNIKA